ncbi:MAG: hypothetical protein KDA24_13390 [Deltaproteobacteria bacterium]|nr:hypothetical protein [Deltaproteobacteria bacterium]
MPATFHFVSLECIKRQEKPRDEIVVLYQGKQAFPVLPEKFAQMGQGDILVNGKAPLPAHSLAGRLGRDDALDISGFYEVDDFLAVTIPTQGLGVTVMELDAGWSADDLIGKFLVSPIPTPKVQSRRLTGSGAEYEFCWIVTPGAKAPADT